MTFSSIIIYILYFVDERQKKIEVNKNEIHRCGNLNYNGVRVHVYIVYTYKSIQIQDNKTEF